MQVICSYLAKLNENSKYVSFQNSEFLNFSRTKVEVIIENVLIFYAKFDFLVDINALDYFVFV